MCIDVTNFVTLDFEVVGKTKIVIAFSLSSILCYGAFLLNFW